MPVPGFLFPGEDACFRAALTKRGLVVRVGQVTQVPFVTLVTEYLILILTLLHNTVYLLDTK